MEWRNAIAQVSDKLEGWARGLILMLPNLLVAILVLGLFWLLAKAVRRVALSALKRVSHNQRITELLVSMIGFAVLATGLFIALGVLELQKTVATLLAGAGLVGLALGFAFQDIAANFMAGLLISLRHPFRIGDIIETQDYFGTVKRITLRSTELLRPEGQLVLIPNKQVFENPIVNFTRLGQRRVDLRVGVSYGDDLALVKDVATVALEAVPDRDQSQPVEVFFAEFGDSSVDLDARFWIPFRRQTDYLKARSEAIERLKAAFDRAGITIPFPIRTLDLGRIGGESAAEVAEALAPIVEHRGREHRGPRR